MSRIVVVGAGRSGMAVAAHLARSGEDVVLTDRRADPDPALVHELGVLGVPCVWGAHPEALLEDCRELVLSPGVEPVRPAILHCDARSAQQVREMNRLLGAERVRALTLNPIYTGFLLTSLLWVRENEPEKYSRIKQVCLPKDYIRYRLCGSVA